MNEQITQLAEQAKLKTELWNTPEPFVIYKEDSNNPGGLERFAALIRADEREACAKVCDDAVGTWNGWPQAKSALTVGAMAIRARGNA